MTNKIYAESGPIRIGISACLAGESVRWNGGHCRDRFLTDTLGAYLEYVPVCPEVECGLGIPRETLRLTGDPDHPRLVTSKTQKDLTEQMQHWAKSRVRELAGENLCGFIFKKDSPSSGLFKVKVYNDKGGFLKNGVGLFARAFVEHFPLIPAEEEGRLNDSGLRENFIESIFTLKRWRDTLKQDKRMGTLVDFHTHHKLLILSHSPVHYRAMGKLVAEGKKTEPDALYQRYEELLLEALRLKTTTKKQVNVLQHMMGYFKKQLTGDEKKELLEIIDEYRIGNAPLLVPITLINHYIRKYEQPYLSRQVYLKPHPVELKLRTSL
ncbi:MAG: DUF1722 domain-containing protein [Desulfobacteraceae bacterium]|nr:MAG: DUF1722 domain-containing protein [Desulfobacteraceae bacterium]